MWAASKNLHQPDSTLPLTWGWAFRGLIALRYFTSQKGHVQHAHDAKLPFLEQEVAHIPVICCTMDTGAEICGGLQTPAWHRS